MMHFLFAILTILNAGVHCTERGLLVSSPSENTEICTFIGQPSNISDAISLTPNSNPALQVTQNSCAKYFVLDTQTYNLIGKFLQFEIRISSMPTDPVFNPVLILSSNQLPKLYFDVNGIVKTNFDYFDENGYLNRKMYHTIILSPNQYKAGDKIYIGFLDYFQTPALYLESTVNYQVSVKSFDTQPCPNDCSGKGYCINGKCSCSPGIFDIDCSIDATLIPVGVPNSKLIPALSRGYFYFPIQNFIQEIDIQINKGLGRINLFSAINNPQVYDLPNQHQYNWTYVLLGKIFFDKFSTKRAIQNSQSSANYLVAVYNTESYDINLDAKLVLKETDDDWRTLTSYTLIGFCGFFLLSAPIISYCRTRSSGGRDSSRERIAPGRPLQPQPQKLNKPSTFKIGKYFPKKKFGDCKSNFEQIMCSICIDEFKNDDICRQLYCSHIFHYKCIESWIKNDTSCPNCKAEITEEAVDAFYEKKLKEEAQKKTYAKQETGHNISVSFCQNWGKELVPEEPLSPAIKFKAQQTPKNNEINILHDISKQVFGMTIESQNSKRNPTEPAAPNQQIDNNISFSNERNPTEESKQENSKQMLESGSNLFNSELRSEDNEKKTEDVFVLRSDRENYYELEQSQTNKTESHIFDTRIEGESQLSISQVESKTPEENKVSENKPEKYQDDPEELVLYAVEIRPKDE